MARTKFKPKRRNDSAQAQPRKFVFDQVTTQRAGYCRCFACFLLDYLPLSMAVLLAVRSPKSERANLLQAGALLDLLAFDLDFPRFASTSLLPVLATCFETDCARLAFKICVVQSYLSTDLHLLLFVFLAGQVCLSQGTGQQSSAVCWCDFDDAWTLGSKRRRRC